MAAHRYISHRRYFLVLSALFSAWWLLLAIEPYDRADWALENVLVVIGAILLWLTYRHLPLSRVSYTCVFVFLCFHAIGAHYTYALTPYDEWFLALTGTSFNALVGWDRNNFDRIAHFLYGLLLAYPIRELYFRIVDIRGFWGYFLPLDLTASTSMLYELIEWGAAELVGGDLGMAYLGTQGDPWDAHKDMLLAASGAFIAILITLLLNLYLQKDFNREWAHSLRIKHHEPLGEDEIMRLWRRWRGRA